MILNEIAWQEAKAEYGEILKLTKIGTGELRLSKLAEEALEAAILKYLISDDRLKDILSDKPSRAEREAKEAEDKHDHLMWGGKE